MRRPRGPKPKLLSPPMIAMLRSIEKTGNPEYHLRGRAQHAAARQTLRALRERGLVVKGARLLGFKLTDAGLVELLDAAVATFLSTAPAATMEDEDQGPA